MVDKMTRYTKKGLPKASLSASKEDTSAFRNKCKHAWSFIKQVWYVPFIWSLAWFSYWIFQETIAIGQPLSQGSNLNFLGAAISVCALLIKGGISRKSDKKTVKSKKKAEMEEKIWLEDSKLPDEKAFEESTSWESEILEAKDIHYSSTEANQTLEPHEMTAKNLQDPATSSKIPTQNTTFDQTENQEIPSDCLLCPNLANCDQRQRRSAERGIPCPFLNANTEQ